MHRLARWWATATIALLVTLGSTTAAWAQGVVFTVTDPTLGRVVGLTQDPGNKLYWLAQPGDATSGLTTVTGVDPAGAVVARLSLSAVIEPVAIAWSSQSLYLAAAAAPVPTGAAGATPTPTARATPTPTPASGATPAAPGEAVFVLGLPAAAVTGDKEVPYSTYQFLYPDGPHDTAALLVRPDGRLFLVTGDGRFYEAPATPSLVEPMPLAYVTSVPAGVTAGLFLSPDVLAVRTSDEILLLDAITGAVTHRATLAGSSRGLALSVDGTELLTAASDAAGVTLSAWPVPGEPSAPSSASVTGSRPASQTGTLVMILAAALLAVVGGVLAYLRD